MIFAVQPSLIAFYGGTVVAVVALFSTATRFGETSLVAPPAIDGRYSIATTGLPGCLATQAKVLQINQSGIFVNGALLPVQVSEAMIQSAAKRPPLTGRFDHERIWLKGSTPQVEGCQETIVIQGTIQGTTLTGTLQLVESSIRSEFTAQREAPSKAESTH